MTTNTHASTRLNRFHNEGRSSPTQFAQTLGVHVSTVWRWIKTGVKADETRVRLSAKRIGGRVFILDVDAERFLDALNSRDTNEKAAKQQEGLKADDRYCEGEGL